MRSAVRNPFHAQPVKENAGGKGLMPSFKKTVLYGGAAFVMLNVFFLFGLHGTASTTTNINNSGSNRASQQHPKLRQDTSLSVKKKSNTQCSFRQYPPRRYYGFHKLEQPDFLTTVEYVYGKLPVMVTPDTHNLPGYSQSDSTMDYHDQGKLCVDQSEWLPGLNREQQLPYADGTNPSILSLKRLETNYAELVQKWRQRGGSYIATICMTDSQCQYQDAPDEVKHYKLSTDTKPTVVQTLLLILDDQFQTIQQTTIYLERDAPWGRKFKKAAPLAGGGYETLPRALDDARLFIHLNKLWVSYREGPSFGYEQQVLNEIHMTSNSNKLTATIKASESVTFCCGRNMALMEHLEDPTQLQSLTWADPVTVIDVDDGRKDKKESRRQLAEDKKKKKSHFHGTNAFMVYLPKSDEFLGIGHFHRPPSRDAFNPYARFGHHYTHTFFTISSRPPFRLLRLSQEFVLPSKSKILGDDDAEIIQFLSGLEVVTREDGKDNKDYAVIAYGINDCEGAAVYLSMDRVNELLQPVPEGNEVVDLMGPLIQ